VDISLIQEVKAGMSVAAQDDEIWKRAEILCVFANHVFVLFVDSGIVNVIKSTKLRYLEIRFKNHTRKACKGCLAGVKQKPVNSEEADKFFIEKTRGCRMLAQCKGKTAETFRLDLFDEDSINIGQSMIDKKFLDQAD
jgi:Tudor domain